MEVPSEERIAEAASALNLLLIAHCDRLARALIAEAGPDDSDRSSPQRSLKVLELTKLRIRHRTNVVDLSGPVAAARIAGATWAQIGDAVGTSRQAAYERWHKTVRAFENAARAAGIASEDVLDKYDPFGMSLSPTAAQFVSAGPDVENDTE